MRVIQLIAASAVLSAVVHAAAQHYVSPLGSNEYPYDTWERAAHSIQDAVDAETPTRVFVAPAHYVGNVLVPKGTSVYGAGAATCTIQGVPAGAPEDNVAVVMEEDTSLGGFTVDAYGCSGGVRCRGGEVRDCAVIGAGDGIRAHDALIGGCLVLGNTSSGMYISGVSVVYDTVVSGSSTGVYGIGDGGYSVLLHCTVSGNGYGLDNLDAMVLAVRDSIVWGNTVCDIRWYWPPDVVGCNTGDARFAGVNGNISADPLFVGWGDFNDSGNSIYVDLSNTGQEDGTKEYPFQTIGAALRKYDFHLALGSPCVGAASDGLNVGAFPYETPVRGPGVSCVRIQVAAGLYEEGGLLLVQGEHLKGPGPGLATLAPRRHLHAASLDRASAIEGFFILVDQAGALSAGAGTTVANCVITTRAFAPWSPSDWGIWSEGARVVNCVIHGMRHAVWGSADILDCTITQNTQEALIFELEAPPSVRNSILWANGTSTLMLPPENVSYSLVSDPALAGINGNILADPQFVSPEKSNFRLLSTSPCIDAGFNDPELPETDIVGMHRIMFGGKSLTVDMGAYEYYINNLKPGPQADETTLSWSSLAEKSYSIFYTEDLLTWHLVVENFPSAGDTITFWTDDGSKTGLPPTLAPRRFYRVLENP